MLGGWLLSRRYGLWYDELYTAEIAPRRMADILSALGSGEGPIPYLRDAPPSYNAPYYLVVHLWLAATGLGPDEWGLRLLSLLASAGAMVAFTAAVTRLAGPRTGLVAGLIAASNPFVVAFAAEARGYGIALLATALAALGLARWLEGGGNRALALYGVAGAAAGLAHWFTLLVLVSFATAAWILRRRRALPLVLVTAAASLPVLGLVALAVLNGVGSSGAEWISEVGGHAPPLLLEAWTGGSALLLVVTVATVAGALVPRQGSGDRTPRLVGGLWAAVPVAMVMALELLRPVFVARYLLPATLGVAVLMALGVSRLPRVAAALATAAVVLVGSVATVGELSRGPTEDVRSAVAVVAAAHDPGEPVVAAARWDALGLDHYARRDHPALVPDLVLPPGDVPSAPRVWVVRRAAGGVKGDRRKLQALDAELRARGLRITDQSRFDGRLSDVLVQRWESP